VFLQSVLLQTWDAVLVRTNNKTLGFSSENVELVGTKTASYEDTSTVSITETRIIKSGLFLIEVNSN